MCLPPSLEIMKPDKPRSPLLQGGGRVGLGRLPDSVIGGECVFCLGEIGTNGETGQKLDLASPASASASYGR